MALSFGLSLISEAITAGGASLVLPFAGATALDSRITFTRASTATYVGSNGLLQTAAVNAPRLVYNPVTLAAQGLLVEEQRTNLLTYSIDSGSGTWGKNAVTSTANQAIGPDGQMTADLFAETAVTAQHNFFRTYSATTGVVLTFSILLKAKNQGDVLILSDAGQSRFNLLTGVVVSTSGQTSKIEAYPNGWYRCSITWTAVTTGLIAIAIYLNNGASYLGNVANGVYNGGAQLEAGAFATSYIPTTTAQATRAADVATMTGTNFSSWYNQTEGTLCVEMKLLAAPASGTYPGFAKLYADNGNKIGFYTVISGTIVQFAAASNYTSSADIQQVQSSVSSYLKVAGAYKLNDFAFSANGATAAVDTSGQIPTVSSLVLNRYDEAMNGTIKSITYYPRRLANTELQALTS